MSRMQGMRRGFTLIELMIVVAIIGVLAALAIPAFNKYVKESKTTEAYINLKVVSDGAANYYERLHYSSVGEPLLRQFPSKDGTSGDLGDSQPVSVPLGVKSRFVSNVEPWKALKVNITKPVYYKYTYTPDNDINDPRNVSFEVRAEGDIDADTTTSRFNLNGSSVDGELKLTPIFLTNLDNILE